MIQSDEKDGLDFSWMGKKKEEAVAPEIDFSWIKKKDTVDKPEEEKDDINFDWMPAKSVQSKDVLTLTPSLIESVNKKAGSNFSTAGKDIMRYNSFDPYIAKAAQKKGEDPNLIKFLMLQESRMVPGQTSPAGYYGLSQTNKATIDTINKNYGTDYKLSDMNDPEKAAMFMADYIKLAKKFGAESWDDFIVAYNRGVGHIKTHKAGGEHPEETQKYLQSGMAFKDSLDEINRQKKAEETLEEQEQFNMFDEVQEKYRSNPRSKNIALGTGISDVIVNAVQKHRQRVPRARGGQFQYDKIQTRLNGMAEMFPEIKQEVASLQAELNSGIGVDRLPDIEQRMMQLENTLRGDLKFMGSSSLGGALSGGPSRRPMHPNWNKYEQEIVNNPAYAAVQSLLENTQKINEIKKMEKEKSGTMAGRFAKGVGEGILEEAVSYVELPQMLENNAYTTRLVKKLEEATKSEDTQLELTPEEEHLFRALLENIDAREDLDPQRFNSAYNWGLGLGKNMSFIAELALTKGVGTATREGLERFATKGVIGGTKAITVPQHVLAKLAGLGVQTTYMPRVWKNTAVNVSNGVPEGQAFIDAWYDTFNEVYSENLFVGKVPSMKHGDWADELLSKTGSALRGRKGMMGHLKAVGEEYLEEKYAEIGMVAKDNPNPKDFWKGFIDPKANLHTMGSVAIMTGVLGSPSIARDTKAYIQNKMDLNGLKTAVDAKLRGDIDIILEDTQISVAQAYEMIFDRVKKAAASGEIKGDLSTNVVTAMQYAVVKTQNETMKHYASTKALEDYKNVRRVVEEGIKLGKDEKFIEALANNGIILPKDAGISSLIEHEAVITPEKARTPEQKEFVKNLNKAIEEFTLSNEELIKQTEAKAQAKKLQEQIDFDTEQKTRMEEEIKQSQDRINELNEKTELTPEESTELKNLGTLIEENQEKISDLGTSLTENQQMLTEIKSQISETKVVDTQEDTKKSPKSETTVEPTLTKEETEVAKKARIVPKTYADLKRVGTEVFGLNKTQANAFAVITDRLIRNQAKRAGVSVEEMYATYDFRKGTKADLAELLSEKGKKTLQEQKGDVSGAFLLSNGQRVIFALTNPNVSTPMHEMAHAFEMFLTAAEKKAVLKWTGATSWDANVSEKFAQGFEKYLQEGVAPTPELAKVFQQFKKWLLEIYNAVAGAGLDVKLNDKMRSIYDSMLAETQEKSKAKDKEGEVLFQEGKQDSKGKEGEVRSQTLPKTIEIDGVKRPTTNSKGQQIHPTEEGVKNFWKWFGDSKVVDKDGRPLVVYHGSPYGGIREFDRKSSKIVSSGLKEFGVFFTTNPKVAEVYRTGRKLSDEYKKQLDIERRRLEIELYKTRNNREWDAIEAEMGRIDEILAGKIYEAYLKIDNLHEFNAKAKTYPDSWQELSVDVGYKIARGIDAVEALKGENNAYKAPPVDGILAKNLLEVGKVVGKGEDYGFDTSYLGDTYLIFDGHPENIKSTENLGTFSPETGDILFQTATNLSEQFPELSDKNKQSKQKAILTRLQNELNDTIKYVSSVINNQPDDAEFVMYNGKTYAIVKTKLFGKPGVSVRNMEQKGTQNKGIPAGKFIRDNVINAAGNKANVMTKEEALNRVAAYLSAEYMQKAKDSISKLATGVKPPKREKEPIEVKPISSLSDLVDRIKIERNAVKDFQKAIARIREMIVESAAKEFITAGQYMSILRRISMMRNDLDISKAMEYIQDVVDGAGYKKQLASAKKWVDSLKSNADKFGTGYGEAIENSTVKEMVGDILKMDIRTLTVEDLAEFNKIAALVDIRSMNPKIWHIQQLHRIAQRAEESTKEAKEITVESLTDAVAKYKEDYGGKLETRKQIIAAQKALSRLKAKYLEYLSQGKQNHVQTKEGESSELESVIAEIGELVGSKNIDGALQELIEKEKVAYIESVAANMNEMRDKIEEGLMNIPTELRIYARRLLNSTKEDLSKLTLAEVEAFDVFVQNLSHGYINPVVAELDLAIGTNRLKSKILDKFFQNLTHSKQFNNWVAKYYLGRDTRVPFSRKKYNVQQLLQEAIWSRQAHRIDTWLGNYDKDHTIGSIYNFVGRGVSRESITAKKYDEMMQLALDGVNNMFSKTIKGEKLYMTVTQKAQRDRRMAWIGMVLAEQSYQSTDMYLDGEVDSHNVSIMHNNYVGTKIEGKKRTTAEEALAQENNKRKYKDNQANYNALMDFLRKNDATKEVDGIEIMDTEKALQLLRKDKPIAKYIDTLKAVLNDTKGMAAWSTFSNGRSFVELDNYLPFFVIRNKSMLDADKIRQSMNIGRVPAKMQAGATYERSGALNYIEINPQTIMKRYVEEVARNYHVYGEMKKAVSAVIAAGMEANENESGSKRPIFHNLTKTIVADIKLRIDQHYGMNSFSGKVNAMNTAMKAIKLGLLPTAYRPINEYASNALRAYISTGAFPVNAFASYKEHPEVYTSLIEDFIGEKYMSRWGEEIRGSVFDNKHLKKMENMARGIVTFADTAIGKPLFVHEFNRQFKVLTNGKDFNPALYSTNERYRIEHEHDIERSAVRAVRKVEELFNDKAPISAPTHLRFWGGLWVPRRDSIMAQWFGFLMSFNRNEAAQLIDSYKRIKYSGDPKDVLQGYSDIAAIVLSNTLYGIMRTGMATLMLSVGQMAIQAIKGGDDEDKRLKKRMDDLKKFSFYQDKFFGSLADLGLGGSAQLTLFTYRWAMYLADKTNIGKEKTREKIKNFMAKELYQRHIPSEMSFNTAQTITSSIPVPSALTNEVFNMVDDFAKAIQILDFLPIVDIIDGTADKDEVLTAWTSLFLTGIKLAMPNPFSPTFQKFWDHEVRKQIQKKKSEGSDNPEADLFNEMFDNSGIEDQLFQDIEDIENLLDMMDID